jgi:hypothetical protein
MYPSFEEMDAAKKKKPEDHFRAARAELADAIRALYLPNPQDEYQRLLPALRLDEKQKPRLRIRHIDESAPNGCREEFLSLREGIQSLLAADGPDQRYVRKQHEPRIPTAEEVEAERVEKARRELRFTWVAASPFTRELLRLADVADARDRRLLLALARLFNMGQSDLAGNTGKPAECAAEFFGINTDGKK